MLRRGIQAGVRNWLPCLITGARLQQRLARQAGRQAGLGKGATAREAPGSEDGN